jgi:hypothetical protein
VMDAHFLLTTRSFLSAVFYRGRVLSIESKVCIKFVKWRLRFVCFRYGFKASKMQVYILLRPQRCFEYPIQSNARLCSHFKGISTYMASLAWVKVHTRLVTFTMSLVGTLTLSNLNGFQEIPRRAKHLRQDLHLVIFLNFDNNVHD